MMNVEIAQRLAERRKQAGLSQEALAEKLGVSRQAVSKWERSESSPDTDNLIALARLYGVSLDDLLYVDEATQDDVVFEVADRARASDEAGASGSPVDDAPPNDPGPSKVRIGVGGIHVEDGSEKVHISWREGIHVVDGEKGEEVHVGWNGVHVKSPKNGPDDDEVLIDGDNVIINGEQFDSWHDAHAKYGHGHGWWSEPCGYTVQGERLETLDDAREKYGDEVGKSIPVRKHYLGEFERSWLKFPYPLVVILAYLLIGVMNGEWGLGLFLFFTVPLYYMVGHAVGRKRIAPLVAGAYPLGVTAWFFYMAFVLSQPHPAWVAFLTIPLVEWLVFSLSRWWRDRRRRKRARV